MFCVKKVLKKNAEDRGDIMPGFKYTTGSVFWIGENAGDDNGQIHNHASAWDSHWLESYGGVDDPVNRNGYNPVGFTPKENPFYCALPYNDLTDAGLRKSEAQNIPWFATEFHRTTILKNRWVAIEHNGRVVYAQWEDVGPFYEDDFAFVFGDADTPKNKKSPGNLGAGIDLSPAAAAYLGVNGAAMVGFKHVEASAVPGGPWNDIVTMSPARWK